MPPYVVTTTAPSCSATFRSCADASAETTPPPTQITTRLLPASSSAAFSTAAGSPAALACSRRPSTSTSAFECRMSVGTSISMGPGRSVWNRLNASSATCEISWCVRGMAFQRVTESNICCCLNGSCRKPSPLSTSARSTLLVTCSTGDDADHASPSAPRVFAAPGPVLVKQTPGLPVARA